MALSIKAQIEKIKQRKAGGGKKTNSSGMQFRASKGNTFVLFIGDEGTILVYIKDGTVQSRQFVPDTSPQSLGEFRQTIIKDANASIIMVLDTMDQTYLQQTLPPVSSLSVNKLIKRRLDREFGSVEIKGALPLGRETTGRKDWNFIMVAVEKSPQLAAWLEFVEDLPNHFRGIRLVSVESENIVKFIDKAANLNADGAKHKWKFFVSHNKVGGFRQVILKDGRIVFTRLAQPIGESNIEMVAGNIEQEMQSTIEYMKRLSFNPQDGLDIYIIASSGIKAAIDRKKFPTAVMHIYTPYEFAECMGIEGATQPADQFGDVILAATIGCSRKHVLPFTTVHSKRVDQYRQLLAMQRMVGVVCSVGMVGYAGVLGVGMFSMSQEAGDMEDKMKSQRSRIEALRQEINRSDIDIEKANHLLELYMQLQQEKSSPHAFLGMLMPIKQSPVWVKQIIWEMTSKGKNEGMLAAVEKSGMKAEMQIEFLDVINDRKAFKLASKKILEDMKVWLPGYDVSYTSLPTAFTEQTALQTSIDTEEETAETQPAQTGPVEATVTIQDAATIQQAPAVIRNRGPFP
ncbi:MAG: hypothetical protein ACK502_02740 [Alphaproteobacteria bacterium]